MKAIQAVSLGRCLPTVGGWVVGWVGGWVGEVVFAITTKLDALYLQLYMYLYRICTCICVDICISDLCLYLLLSKQQATSLQIHPRTRQKCQTIMSRCLEQRDSRGNMFHKYVCCIEFHPPAITIQCQCTPPSLYMTLSNKCSCIRSRHEDKVPVCFYKGAGWPSRGALRIALCDVTLVFSFSRIGVSHVRLAE